MVLTSYFSVELPGIEPDALPGNMHSELHVRSISFRFNPSRYLRFCSRILTASRAVKGVTVYAKQQIGLRETGTPVERSPVSRPALVCAEWWSRRPVKPILYNSLRVLGVRQPNPMMGSIRGRWPARPQRP